MRTKWISLGENGGFGETLGVPWEEEEATKKRQEERRKTQHDRSKMKEGSTNTKGKQKQNLYIQTPDQPLPAAPY